VAIFTVGIGLTYTTFVTYWKRIHRIPLLYVSIAFGLITAGIGMEFLLLDLGYSLTLSHTADSTIIAVALAIVLYAIHITR
jgi:hypothetical protein